MLQLIPTDAFDFTWCGSLAEVMEECLPTVGMSGRDQFARLIGHGDGYESDGMGNCASVAELSDAELVVLNMVGAADQQHVRGDQHVTLDPSEMETSRWAYIRSDDHGFWGLMTFATEAEAQTALAEWVEVNVHDEEDDE